MLVLDNRGLEPPEPMQKTLEALSKLGPGESMKIINDRKPMFLFGELDEMGHKYEVTPREDNGFEIVITKKEG